MVALATALLVKERPTRVPAAHLRVGQAFGDFVRRLRADPNLRLFMTAHFCWEFSLAAIRAFVILYLLHGLDVRPLTLVKILIIVVLAYLVPIVTHQVSEFEEDGSLQAGPVEQQKAQHEQWIHTLGIAQAAVAKLGPYQ